MDILIITEPCDIHSEAVAFALQTTGHRVTQLIFSDFPQKVSSSTKISDREAVMEWGGLPFSPQQADVIWTRRIRMPIISSSIAKCDRAAAERDCQAYVDGILETLPRQAFWINPLSGARKARNKIAQLVAARRVGLNIPETLISNNPPEVKAFYDRLNGNIIFKPLRFSAWVNTEFSASLLTARVTEEHLRHVDKICFSPGIFQACIKKHSELRVNVMGRHMHAIEIFSQEQKVSAIDSRLGIHGTRTAIYQVDELLEKMCAAIMDELGICFGSLDFIIDTDGRYIFLEVNEMGNFLWLEEMQPEANCLNRFVDFIVHGRNELDRSRLVNFGGLDSFYKSTSYANYCDRYKQRHSGVNNIPIPEPGYWEGSDEDKPSLMA